MSDQPIEWPDEHEPTDDELESTLLFDDSTLPPDHRSGFVAVVGRPNAGKSTLMNHYLGQKIAIVSPKAQTTRNQLLGILTRDDAQLIFVDTPGIHDPHHKFGEYMVEAARRAIPESDLVLWVVDLSTPPSADDRLVIEAIAGGRHDNPVVMAANKIDLLPEETVLNRLSQYVELLPVDTVMPISATDGTNLDDLLQAIVGHLPPGPRFFPPDQITDQHIRFIAAEMVREAALESLRQEVPHALAVVVTEYTWRSENLLYIDASIFVERDSQKGIVIGRKGQTLKGIGQRARPQIEEMVDAKVFLELRVRVRPRWRSKKKELDRLGYSIDEN